LCGRLAKEGGAESGPITLKYGERGDARKKKQKKKE
jgi:hypothetical protein